MQPRRPPRHILLAGPALLVLSGACASFGSETMAFRATSGAIFRGPGAESSFDAAVIESASHDIPCPRESVVIMTRSRGTYLVAGCGSLLAYESKGRGIANWEVTYEVTQVARAQTSPSGESAP